MAIVKKTTQLYNELAKSIKEHNISPVYALMGEEDFFIDQLANMLIDELLKPEERDFNLVQLFGADTTPSEVIAAAQAYPFGAEKRVVCVREAQQMKHLGTLENYFKAMVPTTVLIICHKHGNIDKRTKLVSYCEKHGCVFESKPLYMTEVVSFAKSYAAEKNVKLDSDAAQVLADLLGTDLSRLITEIDKLLISFPDDSAPKIIQKDMILEHVGMHRTFNPFELQDALVEKNLTRAMEIAKYFYNNNYPLPATISSLFRFFSLLMLAYYAPEKTPRGIASWLSVKEWQAERVYMAAMKRYTGRKVMQIISELRRVDAQSKGIGVGAGTRGDDLLSPLIWYIIND
ncbi:MAG: DNA polymerase III subunit delta [Bacteroidaceae bacterium]|nr:DNA polymerase III subunit delta [Bacteroidaceae bacterium]